MTLWNIDTEKQFFVDALDNFASPEKLFYSLKSGKYAYVPKNCDSEGQTLQSRNALIGNYTETWAKNIFSPIAKKLGLYAVNSVECPEIGLVRRSEADLAFCTTDSKIQPAQNIKLVFEIKMSIVSNYFYTKSKTVEFIGDYKTHQGNPSLLRSDSMLKAIGKSITIRVSGIESTKIPIVVLGNSPITTNSKIQPAQNIKLVFEIKMSIVSNYIYTKSKTVEFIGDYKTHQGNPSLLRSDSMLKAIGKSITIRVSGIESTKIPIVVLGNSPITTNYSHKVDFLKTAGVIQGFWSLNPVPTESEFIKETEKHGFQTIQNFKSVEILIKNLLNTKLNYFSSMISQEKLGEYIRIAYQEPTDEAKAEKFLSLIRNI